jgi:hypothetical protein
MMKKGIFLLILVNSISLTVFAQPVVSDPNQEEKKEQTITEKKAAEDMVLTAPQPALNPTETKEEKE